MTTTPASKLPIRMVSKVVRGFGRGSRELGIPTANLSRESLESSTGDFNSLPCGIYWGFAKIKGSEETIQDTLVYNAAISIGYNPYYKNEDKTVEPHLIAPPNDELRHASSCGETLLGDFYGQEIRLSLVGFLRDEAPFEGLDKLVAAIKNDIQTSEKHCNNEDDRHAQREKRWVDSNEGVCEGLCAELPISTNSK